MTKWSPWCSVTCYIVYVVVGIVVYTLSESFLSCIKQFYQIMSNENYGAGPELILASKNRLNLTRLIQFSSVRPKLWFGRVIRMSQNDKRISPDMYLLKILHHLFHLNNFKWKIITIRVPYIHSKNQTADFRVNIWYFWCCYTVWTFQNARILRIFRVFRHFFLYLRSGRLFVSLCSKRPTVSTTNTKSLTVNIGLSINLYLFMGVCP